MSDIPVGSPPVPPGRHAAPGGWYADPVDPGRERYWDGWQWSRNTRPREAQPPPYTAAAGTAPTGYPGAGPTGYPGPAAGAPGPVPGGYGQPGYPPSYPPVPGYAPPAGPVAVTADGVPLAGWWWRVLAAVIDNILLSIVVTAIAVPLWLPVYEAFVGYWEAIVQAQRTGVPPPMIDPNQLFPIRAQMLLTAVTVGLGLIYHVTFLRWKGATIGKLACRLRVVPVDRGLSRPGLPWNATLIRAAIWVLPGISSLLALFTVVDALFPLWQPKRQALHDLAAKTQVTRAR
jgi:uncharacterized RDD family membrane protein YckC